MNQSKQMARIAVKALEEKKALDLKIIDIFRCQRCCRLFNYCQRSNRNQVHALADNAEEMLGKEGFEPKQIEGYRFANWILMDYRDIIIHIFSEEDRLFYDLERIWRDGKTLSLEDLQED